MKSHYLSTKEKEELLQCVIDSGFARNEIALRIGKTKDSFDQMLLEKYKTTFAHRDRIQDAINELSKEKENRQDTGLMDKALFIRTVDKIYDTLDNEKRMMLYDFLRFYQRIR